jgi:hypothetical protein
MGKLIRQSGPVPIYSFADETGTFVFLCDIFCGVGHVTIRETS